MRLPEKGSSSTSPAAGPAEATAFEAAFSDEEEGEGQLTGPTAEAAVATAEGQDEDVPQSAEAVSNSAGAVSDHTTGETGANVMSVLVEHS